MWSCFSTFLLTFYQGPVTFCCACWISPILRNLSIRVQSLLSKFSNFSDFISTVINHNVPIAMMAMQETWQIPDPVIINLPESFPFSMPDDLSPYLWKRINEVIINYKKNSFMSCLSPTNPFTLLQNIFTLHVAYIASSIV